jgi:hypothetical protein
MNERAHDPRRDARIERSSLVISYKELRSAVGVLGVAFPLVLAVGTWLGRETPVFRESLSDYYYTNVHDEFVGILVAIAFFFFSYRGYARADYVAGRVACVSAAAVALFPDGSAFSWLHYLSAAVLFATLAYFSLFLFRKHKESVTPQKENRDGIYLACGIVIVMCIVAIGAHYVWARVVAPASAGAAPVVFVLETIALWAFGLSWMVKGEAIGFLNDMDPAPRREPTLPPQRG